jgi:Lectin C-type domain
LTEETYFTATRNLPLVIPVTPSILSFKIDKSFDISDADAINDAFEVALVDANGNSLVHTIASGRDAFFNLTEGEDVALGVGANYNSNDQTVRLNLTGVKPGNATLIFRLVNNDSDTTTTVSITEFVLQTAPANTQSSLQSGFSTQLAANTTTSLNFNNLTDVSQSFSADYHRTSFNADTHLLYADIAIHNIGSYSVNAPMIVAVNHISDPTILVRNPDGFTPEGIPYYNFSNLVAGGKLEPNESTTQRSLVFYNPQGMQFSYDLVVLAQLNQAPVIQTQPNKEIIGGKFYSNVRSDRAMLDGLTLAREGTYRLLIDGPGENIGNYNFRLIDKTSAISTALDTDIAGTFTNNGTNAQLYKFSLSERQYLYFDGLNPSPNWWSGEPRSGAWILYGAQGQQISSALLWQDSEFWLDAGEYTLVMQGYGSGYYPDYRFKIITPQMPTSAILLKDVINQDDFISGSISEKGQQDTYTFTGTAGQQLFYDALDGNADLRYTLYDPQGVVLVNYADVRFDRSFFDGLTLPTAGEYRLVIDGPGENTGNYKFRLLNRAAAFNITTDTEIAGSFNNNGTSTELYQFNLENRQYLYFDAQATNGYNPSNAWWLPQPGAWILYAPNGQVIQSDRLWSDREFWLDPGEYILAMQGYGAGYIDNYNFHIVTPDIQTKKAITIGTSVSGAIDEKGEQDLYTFTGEAGQRLYLDILDRGITAYSNRIILLDPTGREILNRWVWDQDSDAFTLLQAGTYTIRIDGDGERTDSYKFNLLDLSTAIDITNSIGGIVNSSNQHTYRLTRTSSWVDARLAAQASGGYLATINDAVENQFLVDTFGSSEYFWIGLSDAAQEGTWNWENGEPLTYTNWGLWQPDNYANEDYAVINWSYPGQWNDVGASASVRGIVELNNSAGILPATDNSGTLDSGHATKLYQFSGNLGQTLRFVPITAPVGSNWTLYNSSNQIVMHAGANSAQTVTLTNTDTFTLAIRGYNTLPTSYTFKITELAVGTPTTPNSTAIFLNNTVNGTISTAGEFAYYTFAGKVGQKLFYDGLGGDYLRTHIYDPTGREIVYDGNIWDGGGIDSRYDFGSDRGLTLGMDGTYQIAIGRSGATGSYNFRLLDLSSAPVVDLDTNIQGTFATGATDSQAFRFNVTSSSQYLYFDALQGDGAWIVYGTNGQSINSGRLWEDREFWLNQGEYFLVMQGYASNQNYNLRIITPDLVTADTPISFNEKVQGTIPKKGGQHYYTFDATPGQKLFYDALGGDYFRVYIYDPSGRLIADDGNWYEGGGVDSRSDRGPDGGLTLTMHGTYRITVDGRGEGTGSYKFRVLDAEKADVVGFDTDIAGTFDHDAKGAVTYRFNVTDRKYLYFDAQQGDGAWVVYRPDGSYVISGRLWEDKELWFDTGEYLLVPYGYGSDANYKIRIVAPQLPTKTYTLGDTVEDAITKKGDRHDYTFTGKAGQRLYLDNQMLSSGFRVSITNKSGRSLFGEFDLNTNGDRDAIVLDEEGTYRITVDATGETTGSYRFQIWDYGNTATMPTQISLDATVMGKFDDEQKRQADLYRFTTTGKQLVYVDAIGGDYNNYWGIYKPNGENLVWGRLTEDKEVFLDAAGQYTLVMWGGGVANNNYKRRLYGEGWVRKSKLVGAESGYSVT